MENSMIYQIGVSATAIFAVDVVLMGPTGEIIFSSAPSFESAARQWYNGPNRADDAGGAGLFREISCENVRLCYAALWGEGAEAETAFRYVASRLQMEYAMQSESEHNNVMDRTYLTNQIINSTHDLSSFHNVAKRLMCTWGAPRCAVILQLDPQQEIGQEQVLAHMMRFLLTEDLISAVSEQKYVILKSVPQEGDRQKKALKEFLEKLIESIRLELGLAAICTVGNAYPSLDHMRQSYQEALFLMDNWNVLSNGQTNILFLENCLADYLFSQLPNDLLQKRYAIWEELLGGTLSETIVQISRHNGNLVSAAKALGIHRNTILQRVQKIKSLLNIDDIRTVDFRTKMRQYSLTVNRKITLNGAIIISSNTPLFQACLQLSEIIRRKSNGTITLNVQPLSDSGDNTYLLHTLQSGSIDFAVLDTSPLYDLSHGSSAVLDLPYLFDSAEQALQISNQTLLPVINGELQSNGITCLGIWSMGWRYITSRRTPIRLPADISGKKIRIMHNSMLEKYFRNMGAVPIQAHYRDIMEGLATNFFDIQENPYANILNMKFYIYQKYVSEFNFNFDTEALLMPTQRWVSLPSFAQEIIREAVAWVTEWLKEQLPLQSIATRTELVQVHGMKAIQLSEEEQKLWRAYAQPLYKEFPRQELLESVWRAKEAQYVVP